MATIPFSILRLPEPALHKSIKQMGLMEQFSLSVLSNKTKHAVTMLPAVKNRVSITMTSSLQLDISNEFQIVEFFFKMDPHYQSVEVRQRSNNRSNTSTELSIPGVSVKFWIEHIVHVFCKDQGALLKLENSAGENFDELYDMIANITIVHLEFMCIELQDYHRLKLFPFLKWLTVYGMDMAPISTTILIQNIQGLHLVHEIKWRINDQRFSKQDLNLFMRQWINGAMPRLEVFHATFTHYDEHKLVETYLFKGIKYTVEDNKYSKIVEIERHDGVKASVCFDEQRSSAFCFSVESEPD